jgi:hypothetical protein
MHRFDWWRDSDSESGRYKKTKRNKWWASSSNRSDTKYRYCNCQYNLMDLTMASHKFSSSLVGRFYSSGSMHKFSVEMKRASKTQEKRRELGKLFAEEQANIAKEQEIIRTLKRASKIDKKLRRRQRTSAALKIQWCVRRFIRNVKTERCSHIQKWYRKKRSKRLSILESKQRDAAIMIRRAVILKCFIIHWHRSRIIALKVQKLYRFRRWYRQQLQALEDKKNIAEMHVKFAADIVSRSLTLARDACLRGVVEKAAVIIIQRHWRNFMYRPAVSVSNRKTGLKFPTKAEVLFLQR